jgi:hypothetical protein
MRSVKIGTAIALLASLAGQARAESGLFVVTSDFQSGSAAYLAPGAAAAETNLLNLHGDAVARYHDGRIYVLNRFGQDNVLVLDPGDLRNPLLQFSVDNGSNPQDIVFAGPTKAYVTRHESTHLLVVDPRDGTRLGEVDLGGFADADGLPEMAEMAVVGPYLYVVCQRLARDQGWGPADVSYLAVVDTRTDALVDQDPAVPRIQGIQLAAANPSMLVARERELVVAEVAGYGDLAGGIEIIDLASGRSTGLVVTEADLGGDVTGLAMATDTHGYAVVSDASFTNWIRPIDLGTGQVGPPLAGHSGGYTPDLVVDGDRLIVADRGNFTDPASQPGLLVYDAATGQKRAGPVPVGLPPASIAVMAEGRSTAVLEPAGQVLPANARLGDAYPNPFNSQTLIPLEIPGDERQASLVVRDVLGRRIRVLVAGPLAAGRHTFSWDGRDDDGQAASSGLFLVELRLGDWRAASKLLLLK